MPKCKKCKEPIRLEIDKLCKKCSIEFMFWIKGKTWRKGITAEERRLRKKLKKKYKRKLDKKHFPTIENFLKEG